MRNAGNTITLASTGINLDKTLDTKWRYVKHIKKKKSN